MTRPAPIIAKAIAIAVIGGAILAVVIVARNVAFAISRGMQQREVEAALDGGLESDCREVFERYAKDPRFAEHGYLRFFPNSPEFQALPPSIRQLQPCYVTIEDRSGLPANIGICKNGFGGFAAGVRVFLMPKNIPKTFWSKPLTSTTYLWEEET